MIGNKNQQPWASLGLIAAMWAMIYFSGCAPTRYVRPLEKGQTALDLSLGGPLFKNFGTPMPVPFVTAGAAHGFTEKLTAYGHLNFTSALFGTIQMDLGASYGWLKPDKFRPGLSTSLTLNPAVDVHQGRFKLWPQLDVNAYWEYGAKRHFGYVGLGSWWEPRAMAHPEEPELQVVVPCLQLGNTFAGNTWDKTIELKWSNFSAPSGDAVVDWASLGQRGAIGVFIGINKRF